MLLRGYCTKNSLQFSPKLKRVTPEVSATQHIKQLTNKQHGLMGPFGSPDLFKLTSGFRPKCLAHNHKVLSRIKCNVQQQQTNT